MAPDPRTQADGEPRPIAVRLATARDVAAIARLIQVLMEHHGKPARAAPSLERAVRYVLAAPATGFLVAETDGEVIGCVQVQHRFSTWLNAGILYLEDFCVDAAWRSRGAGKALLDAVVAQASTTGAVAINLDLQDGNDRARAFYAREGFFDTGYRILGRPVVGKEA